MHALPSAGSQVGGQDARQGTKVSSMIRMECAQPGHLVISIPAALASSEVKLKYV